ncbi:ABC transporter permease [Litorilinea aerophila]|uniref:ABC transporter permease n=1 Tax=Litorilinea aerophila TaxID=1204385 RepID=A0A540VA87_9CHLR|nr:ABC transporter permease [Litorilinea aerophila]MCC9078477.1 ABC transporter permease [Litorilinea aerophila]GIV80064.1 MAG: peptide ABC transporter permease [Litorilinea sp.]
MTTAYELTAQEVAPESILRRWTQAVVHNYLVRKLLKTLFTIFVVTTLIFFLIRLLPGNPIEQYVNQLVVQYGMPIHEARDQAASLFAINLDQPLHIQYFNYLKNLLQGNLGNSILSPGTSVTSIILRFLPWTIFSVGTGLILSFIVGILLGLLMAYRRESLLDHVLTVLASIFSSVPNYLTGIMLVVWLGVQWKLLPIAQMRGSLSSGMQPSFSWAFIQDAFFHAALPITTYVLTTIGGWMLSMKSSTIGVLGEDYVTVARARGLRDWRITTAYVGRNAALPLFTQLTISIGFVVGGSFLIEQIFQYQGIGGILAASIAQRDYTVMQGVFLVITLSVVFANFFADILYSWLDPRIKLGRQD